MSRVHKARNSPGRAPAKAKGTSGSIGYGRPPKQHQFKPGRSGNPKGRPKGSKNEATIWKEVLNKRIAIREAGKSRKVSLLEAMILKFVERALTEGDIKAATFVLNRIRVIGGDSGSTDADSLDHEDQAVLDAFIESAQAKLRPKKD
jgi:Family of unknown function (DUF5681)